VGRRRCAGRRARARRKGARVTGVVIIIIIETMRLGCRSDIMVIIMNHLLSVDDVNAREGRTRCARRRMRMMEGDRTRRVMDPRRRGLGARRGRITSCSWMG
jgi:hypothetical protein